MRQSQTNNQINATAKKATESLAGKSLFISVPKQIEMPAFSGCLVKGYGIRTNRRRYRFSFLAELFNLYFYIIKN